MNVIPCSVLTDDNIANYLAKIAVRALYFEVKAYPKPGLVSFIDSGAHQDMNGETFYRSIFTLRHYFYQISRQGMMNHSFEALKNTAICAERRMLEKTKGINTHRGAIFALGLFCVSVARLTKAEAHFTPAILHRQLLKDWHIILAEHSTNPSSHGAFVRKEHQVIDARQMAMRGYDLVFQLLPDFISLFTETKSIDAVCLYAYLELIMKVDDTNVLYRKGKSGLDYAKTQAAEMLAINCCKARQLQALEIHHLFSKEGISPGGVADLIGVLLFIGQLFCEQLRCHYS